MALTEATEPSVRQSQPGSTQGTKRFFKCTGCGRRETAINRMTPAHPCQGCRGNSFKQVRPVGGRGLCPTPPTQPRLDGYTSVPFCDGAV